MGRVGRVVAEVAAAARILAVGGLAEASEDGGVPETRETIQVGRQKSLNCARCGTLCIGLLLRTHWNGRNLK